MPEKRESRVKSASARDAERGHGVHLTRVRQRRAVPDVHLVRAPSKACPQEAPVAADPLCGVGSAWPFASCSGNASLKAGGITAAAFKPHSLVMDCFQA